MMEGAWKEMEMRKKKLPIGIENFEEIRKEDFYYIDKTGLIVELLHNWGAVNLFTRPRRFGKTLNMSMLEHFFSLNGDKSIFDGLEISKEKELCGKYQGKFPVISISLKDINWINRSAELGIFIGDKEFRGKGYGTEAIQLLLDYGFRYLNLNSVTLALLGVNERAYNCYLKCGFKYSGRDRNAIFLNGCYYDKIHMDILASEFKGEFIRNKNVK